MIKHFSWQGFSLRHNYIFCYCPHLFTRLFFSFLCLGRKQMGHGTTHAAAFGGKGVALSELSHDEYQERTTMSIAKPL